MSLLQLDYSCFSYNDYNFILVKIPESILADIAIPQEYNSLLSDFIFNFTEPLKISNNTNSFLIYSKHERVMQLSNISQSIILDWVKNKKFIFKFLREKTNINSIDHDTLKKPSNIISVMQVN